MAKINFKASEKELLPKDTYRLRTESMEVKTSGPGAKHPGSKYIETQFVVRGDEHDGRKVYHNFSLLPQAGFNLKGYLEAGGVTHSAIPGAGKGEFEIDFDTDDCVGAEVLGEIDQVTYTKKDQTQGLRNEIVKFLPV